MGKIFEDYKEIAQEYRDVIPPDIINIIENVNESEFPKLEATQEDRDKFFVEGYEELSDAIFNLLHSGVGMYIVNYNAKFSVNRKSAGFNSISDLVHYSIWVIETYNKTNKNMKEHYDTLAEKDRGKTTEEILKQVLACNKLSEEIREITFNMKNNDDFTKRLALIQLKEENECLAYKLLNSLSFHKTIDNVYNALNGIENIHLYNIPPQPLKQSFWDAHTV